MNVDKYYRNHGGFLTARAIPVVTSGAESPFFEKNPKQFPRMFNVGPSRRPGLDMLAQLVTFTLKWSHIALVYEPDDHWATSCKEVFVESLIRAIPEREGEKNSTTTLLFIKEEDIEEHTLAKGPKEEEIAGVVQRLQQGTARSVVMFLSDPGMIWVHNYNKHVI